MLKKIIILFTIAFSSFFTVYALPSSDFPYEEDNIATWLNSSIIRESDQIVTSFVDENTLKEKSPIMFYLSKVINYFLWILGLVAVITLIYGFSLVFTSVKSEEWMKKWYKYIQYAVIAIIIIWISFLIAKFMFQAYFEWVVWKT